MEKWGETSSMQLLAFGAEGKFVKIFVWFNRVITVETGQAEVVSADASRFNQPFNTKVVQTIETEMVADLVN